jgi:hypothetical protein
MSDIPEKAHKPPNMPPLIMPRLRHRVEKWRIAEVREPPNPLGLRTRREAAARLRMSPKTFDAHVEAGAIRYVLVGRGTVRQRRMFTDRDLDEFVANQTRKDVPLPCLSAKTRAHPIGTTISNGEVVAFSARPRKPASAKPKR